MKLFVRTPLCSVVHSDVVLGLGPWSLVVLKDKVSVLGPGLGLGLESLLTSLVVHRWM